MQRHRAIGVLIAALILMVGVPAASAINIVVDYTYDTNNFFDTQTKRDAMEAVADRFSRIIISPLAAVTPSGTGTGTSAGWRVGFTHPGTGASYQLSTASSAGTDPIGGGADVYGFGGLNADEWILYAGGRSLSSAGQGGTGTGLNYTSTFNDIHGPLHRGIADNTPSSTSSDLPRWGGSIAFDSDGDRNWHFDLATAAPSGFVDFYSIALHEVGHALGLSTSWNQWPEDGAGNYTGASAIAAYNADNGTSLTSLNLTSATNMHWADGTYDSTIFAAGQPNYVGTVGSAAKQDLLMEPIANFIYPTLRRFELTNVDVAALEDIGWSVVSALVGDLDGDGDVDNQDIGTATGNFTGAGGSTSMTYADGDIDGDGDVDNQDIGTITGNFTGAAAGQPFTGTASVPEPTTLAVLGVLALGLVRRGGAVRRPRPCGP
jgi:hypothetical protein